MLANGITLSRMLFSLLLLGLSPSSRLFVSLYLVCGLSDVLDGFAARKLHTESETGAMLDSLADVSFAVVYAARILPRLSVPLWIWIWTAMIAAVKVSGILLASKKAGRFFIRHSFANKLTGILVFLLPLSVDVVDVKYSVIPVCASATFAAIEELCGLKRAENEQI